MKKMLSRSVLIFLSVAVLSACNLQLVLASHPLDQGITLAQNNTTNQNQNAAPAQAPNRTPDLYPYGTPRQSPDQFPTPAQNPTIAPGKTPNIQLPAIATGTLQGQTPGTPPQSPNQTPDLYPNQTPLQSPDQFPGQIPSQSPDQLTPQISTAAILSGPSTGQPLQPVLSSSSVQGQQLLQSTATVPAMSPQGRGNVPLTRKVQRHAADSSRLRSSTASPVTKAIEQKSPEGVENDRTFQKDMDDRLERFDRQINELELKTRDAIGDRRIAVDRKLDELRQEKNGVRTMLQDFAAPPPAGPKEYDRAQIENALDRLDASARQTTNRLQRSSPAGDIAGNEFTFERRDEFRRATEGALADVQKRIDRLSKIAREVSGEEQKKLEGSIRELEQRKSELQERLNKIAAVSRDSWSAVRQDIEKGLTNLEQALRSTESERKQDTGNEGIYNQGKNTAPQPDFDVQPSRLCD